MHHASLVTRHVLGTVSWPVAPGIGSRNWLTGLWIVAQGSWLPASAKVEGFDLSGCNIATSVCAHGSFGGPAAAAAPFSVVPPTEVHTFGAAYAAVHA